MIMTGNSEKHLILIIDDEEVLRDGCRQVLERCGYDVLTAGQGNEGIKLARERMPDMAFIDLKMPNMSGMEIIEILSRDIPDIVLVMITGFATIVSAVEAMQKGAYDYLPKPFNPDQLRALTKRALEHRNLKIETKRLREEKDQMERNFITFVSHEMRAPLVVIRQYIEALNTIAGDRFEQDVKEIIERCAKRVHNLEEMVAHWLDISRIENGTLTQQKVSLNLDSIISRSVEEMAPLCRKKGIALETNSPRSLPPITGDTESLVRVFTNIIGNATKYTPEGGKITVTVKNDEYYITVSIADNGTGIPPEKLPLIFEPFYRCAEKNEKHSGSGLGLTFCKKIMESHNGVIDVSSGEGEGSIFVLTFPVSINTERNASGEIQ
ncbi:MAG: hybrid sensor histidine kinase/response regulator [Chloroflexi bacterium]|jgi:signal transduction histidine kinase|nr:hybrid sensor histidine kinase/response regulator [Chloroflexota bacterium]